MIEVKDNKELLEAIKKNKEETIIFDEAGIFRDIFLLSGGNKLVLETIPAMMEDKVYRNKLRLLVMDFKMGKKE